MDFVNQYLVSLVVFTPLIGMALIGLIPSDQKGTIKWTAFLSSLVPAGLSIYLWFAFDSQWGAMQFVDEAVWYAPINAAYRVGVDGLSVPMVLLTGILTPLAILASFSVQERIKPFMMLFLMLETGMFGVFAAQDLLLFFLFWEIGLVPMYFLINQWGSANRRYASFKFFVYTMAGSLGLLLSIQMIGLTTGTFDMTKLPELWPAFNTEKLAGLPISTFKTIAFFAFCLAFAIKVPMWPFHTWLPDAHTEAPTGGSMILAGVLLKLGAYGFLRLVIPLFPEQSAQYAPILAFLALLAIVFGAFAAYGQTDFKRLVAYSSVNHMGFVVLGIAVVALVAGREGSEAWRESAAIAGMGAVLQMFNHGLSAAAMFFLVGVVYERTHTRDLNEIGGGLWQYAPIYGGILIFSSMASLGLPGLNGFVSEFAVVRGAWPIFTVNTAIGTLGLLFTGAYILKGIQKVLHGPKNPKWAGHVPDMNLREIAVAAPLMALMLLLGVWPMWLAKVINEAVVRLLG
ncbi:MAG TPA: NADH-quinone oxidoreductase subunit M [Anaerolineales bacterium]|nr:NADH-quinone oxidoreductase subunit M [Anaerolineales bacterium]